MSKKTVKSAADAVKTVKNSLSAAQLKLVMQQIDSMKWNKQQELHNAESAEKAKYNPLLAFMDDAKTTEKQKKQVIEDVCDYIKNCNRNYMDGYVPVMAGSSTDRMLSAYKDRSHAENLRISDEYKKKLDDLTCLIDDLKLRVALATSYEEVLPLINELRDFKC